MSTSNANPKLKDLVKREYEEGKADLFAAFIVWGLRIARKRGFLGMITQQSWMFLQSYESLRKRILEKHHIENLVHLGPGAFETIGGEIVQTVAFLAQIGRSPGDPDTGIYIRLVERERVSKAVRFADLRSRMRVAQKEFWAIPGTPIVYWISTEARQLFKDNLRISDVMTVTGGMTTGDNDRFVRFWFEVGWDNFNRHSTSRKDSVQSGKRWFPYNKGGAFRRWFGNRDRVVNWHNDGEEIINSGRAYPRSRSFYFREGLTYTATSSSHFGIRYTDPGFIFDAKGSSCFANDRSVLLSALGFLSSKVSSYLLSALNPTIEFQTGNIGSLPFKKVDVEGIVQELVELSRADYDSRELSWSFSQLPLARNIAKNKTLHDVYTDYTEQCTTRFIEIHELESKNMVWIARFHPPCLTRR